MADNLEAGLLRYELEEFIPSLRNLANQVERLEAQRKQLREALLDLMAASGALNGNPASDNPHEAKARAALKATE